MSRVGGERALCEASGTGTDGGRVADMVVVEVGVGGKKAEKLESCEELLC